MIKQNTQIIIIEQRKNINLIRNLLLFIGFLSFVHSTNHKTDENSNLYINIILEKLNSGDLGFLEDENNFIFISSMIEDEKQEIVDKKSLENFDETFLILKLINKININVISSNYEVTPIKETNKILDILIENVSEISEIYINNTINYNIYLNFTVLNLIGIYSNYKNNDLNFQNFNEKIIPIIYKILDDDNNEFKKNEKYIEEKFFLQYCMSYMSLFILFTENVNFFLNLDKNEKLKKLLKNIIDKYISFVIIDKKVFIYYETVIDNFLDDLVLEIIKNNDSCKEVFFEIIDYFLKRFTKILDNETCNIIIFDLTKCFLDKLFKNIFYLKNMTDLDTLINILKKITDIKLDNNIKEVDMLFLEIKMLYIKNITKFYKENNINASKVIRNFEEKSIKEKIKKLIDFKNLNKVQKSYYLLYLYKDLTTNFENDKLHNLHLINFIKNILDEHVNMIIKYTFGEFQYNLTEIFDYFKKVILLFYYNIEFERFDFKNIIRYKTTNLIEQLSKKIQNLKLSESINFTIKDENFVKFALGYQLIDINKVEARNLLIEFFKIYSYKISKSVNNFEDIELFIILSSYIKNLSKKLSDNESSKNNFIKKINKLTFRTEIQEFIENEDGKDLKELFIIKFINAIIESDLKILEILEEFYKENFKNFMVEFIDDFKKLDIFYDTETNNNSEFRIFYYNFNNKIFFFKIVDEDNETNFYWSENDIRKEIYEYFEEKFVFYSNYKQI